MLRTLVALLALSIVPAANAQDGAAHYRTQLNAPIFFSGTSGGGTGGEDGGTTPVVEPLTASLSTLFPTDATAGQSFSTSVLIAGGKAPYDVELLSGALPSGILFGSDRTIIAGEFLQASSAFSLRVSDVDDRTVDIEVPAIEMVQPFAFSSQPTNINAFSNSNTSFAAPLPTGGKGPYTRTLVGTRFDGMTVSQSNGSITLQNPVVGNHGPFHYVFTDAAGRTIQSDSFRINVTKASGMRMTTSTGWAVTFFGWTSTPSNFQDVMIHSSGTISFRFYCPTGNMSISISSGVQNGATVGFSSGTATCKPANLTWNEYLTQQLGQPVPTTLVSITRGTIPSAATSYGSTWTKVDF